MFYIGSKIMNTLANISWINIWATAGTGGAMAYTPEIVTLVNMPIPISVQVVIMISGVIIAICTAICSIIKTYKNWRDRNK